MKNQNGDGYVYGERLLSQMGWSRGKGLGKNEDGIKEFIKIKKKVNTKGIGFNGVDDKWIEHQEAFNELLANLNGGTADTALEQHELLGIEERALRLGGRVHYSKFLRGKDLSQKKQSDLDAIIIKRKKDKPTDSNNNFQEGVADSESQFPNTHTSSISYQEYFALRMGALKAASDKAGNGSAPKEPRGSHSEKDMSKDTILSTIGSSHQIKREHRNHMLPNESTEAHLPHQRGSLSDTRWLAEKEKGNDDITSPAEAEMATTSSIVGKKRKKAGVVIDGTSEVDKTKWTKKSGRSGGDAGNVDEEAGPVETAQLRKKKTANCGCVQNYKKKSRGTVKELEDDEVMALKQFSEDREGEPSGSDGPWKQCRKIKKDDMAEECALLAQKSRGAVGNMEDDKVEVLKQLSEDGEANASSEPRKQRRKRKKGDLPEERALMVNFETNSNGTNGEEVKTNGKCKKKKLTKRNELNEELNEGDICKETTLVLASNLENNSTAKENGKKMGLKQTKKSTSRNEADRTKLEGDLERSSDGAEPREAADDTNGDARSKRQRKLKQKKEADEVEYTNGERSTELGTSYALVMEKNGEDGGKSRGSLKLGKPFKMLKHKKKPRPIVKRGALPVMKEDQASRFANCIAGSQQVTNAIKRHCGGDRALVALRLKNLFLREHKKSNWALIPGYGTPEWLKKCADLLALTMREQDNTSVSEEDTKSPQIKGEPV